MRNVFRTAVLAGLMVAAWYTPVFPDEFTQGIHALDCGQDDLASQCFSSYLAKRPQTYEALLNRGTAFVRSGHIYRAISDWNQAVDLAPLFAYAFYTDDIIRFVTPSNKPIKYVAMIELFPERAVSVVMMGATFLDLGLKSKAVDLFKMSTGLTRDPIFKTDLEYWIKTLDPAQDQNRQQP